MKLIYRTIDIQDARFVARILKSKKIKTKTLVSDAPMLIRGLGHITLWVINENQYKSALSIINASGAYNTKGRKQSRLVLPKTAKIIIYSFLIGAAIMIAGGWLDTLL